VVLRPGTPNESRLSRLRQILFNLLSNAIKYSPEHSPILLRIIPLDGRVRIEVQDKGIGIPKQDQHRLFTRFFRAKNATNIQGTGLGLNIVRHYAQLMGGEIGFVSDVGKGSTFFVHLPFRIPATA